MGKAIVSVGRLNARGQYEFNVLVRVHGRDPHIERYSIKPEDVDKAHAMGYLTKEPWQKYNDWKPLDGIKFTGGIKQVSHYTLEDKHIIAHTPEGRYSLPKYLHKQEKHKGYIFVGFREHYHPSYLQEKFPIDQ